MLRLVSEYVIIRLLHTLCLIAKSLQTTIVLYFNRDGNDEIYTTDSDEGNQTRLAFNQAGESWEA